MSIPQLRDEADGVEACVLSQRVRDKLKCFTVRPNTVGVTAIDFSGICLQLLRHLHLDRRSTRHKESLLDEGPDNTEGIVQRSLSFFEDKLI